MMHNLNLVRGFVNVRAEVWKSKKAKSLLALGQPYPAHNEFFIRVGYVAWDGFDFITKDGQTINCPTKYLKYI